MLEPELIRLHSPDDRPRTGKLCRARRINFFFIYETLNSCQNSVRIQRGGENLEHGNTILIPQISYPCQVRSCRALLVAVPNRYEVSTAARYSDTLASQVNARS